MSFSENLICNECMPICSMFMVEILEYSPKWRTIGVHVCTVIPRSDVRCLSLRITLSIIVWVIYHCGCPYQQAQPWNNGEKHRTDGHHKANPEQPKQKSGVQYAWLDYQLGKLDQTTRAPKAPASLCGNELQICLVMCTTNVQYQLKTGAKGHLYLWYLSWYCALMGYILY